MCVCVCVCVCVRCPLSVDGHLDLGCFPVFNWYVHFSGYIHPGVELLDHTIVLFYFFKEPPYSLPIVVAPIY